MTYTMIGVASHDCYIWDSHIPSKTIVYIYVATSIPPQSITE